jgi:hypothetical protein
LVTNDFCIFSVSKAFQDFTTHFLDEALFLHMAHINDLRILRDAQVGLGILSSCVIHRPFNFTRTILNFSFLFILVGFNKRVMEICGDIMGPRL